MATTLKDQAAIVGIGQTRYSKNSGVSELALACEAVRNAIRDAGIRLLKLGLLLLKKKLLFLLQRARGN